MAYVQNNLLSDAKNGDVTITLRVAWTPERIQTKDHVKILLILDEGVSSAPLFAIFDGSLFDDCSKFPLLKNNG